MKSEGYNLGRQLIERDYENLQNQRKVFEKNLCKVEYDCDLTEVAEKYLSIYSNNLQEGFTNFKEKMTEILISITTKVKSFDTCFIIAYPDEFRVLNRIICNWHEYLNLLFGSYNIYGCSTIQLDKSNVLIVINYGELT